MTFAALALAYLNPWVTMFEDRRAASSEQEIVSMDYTWESYQFDLNRKRLSGAVTNLLSGRPFVEKNSLVSTGS